MSQPCLMSPWRTQTKHSSSSETRIEISLKPMNFKSLVERRRLGVGSAPSLLQRMRGSSSGAVTAQRGTEDGHTDTAGLGGRSLAPESGWGMRRGTVAREMTVLAVVAKVTGAIPGQGMVGAGGDTYPLSPQSLYWEHRVGWGTPPSSMLTSVSCRRLESLLPPVGIWALSGCSCWSSSPSSGEGGMVGA